MAVLEISCSIIHPFILLSNMGTSTGLENRSSVTGKMKTTQQTNIHDTPDCFIGKRIPSQHSILRAVEGLGQNHHTFVYF